MSYSCDDEFIIMVAIAQNNIIQGFCVLSLLRLTAIQVTVYTNNNIILVRSLKISREFYVFFPYIIVSRFMSTPLANET